MSTARALPVPVVADVGDIQGEIIGQGSLDIQVPVEDAGSTYVGVHKSDVAGPWICAHSVAALESAPAVAGKMGPVVFQPLKLRAREGEAAGADL